VLVPPNRPLFPERGQFASFGASSDPRDGCQAMHLISAMSLAMALAMLVCQTVQPARAEYERTHPPLILPATPKATAFYVEFRARDEADGFGHSYVTLGSTDISGRMQQTVVVGFLPKSADDDRLSKFGLPVTGFVGATRSDFAGRPRVRFRVVISRTQYFRVLREIRNLRRTWTTYQLALRNCNAFAGQIAITVGLQAPMLRMQYPVRYMGELRTLNSR
jgi:hypothetical protein